MRRILLLTASFGDGHNQAAEAVREALAAKGVDARLVDFVEWLHPAVRSFAKFSLVQGVQRIPALYGLFYRSMSRIQPSSSLQRQLNQLGMSHMKRCLRAFDPDAVVCTFPTPNGVMSELRASGFTNIPNVTIITDYTAHRQWVHENTDLYFVATDSVKEELVAAGVGPVNVCVTGIPLRRAFAEREVRSLLANREQLREQRRLDPRRPLILMMGGGAGLLGDVSDWEPVVLQSDAQFAIICGRNERLRRRLGPLASDRVRVMGYANDVHEWMAMADIIITKAGGITVTEAFAMELPMLLYRPIPGQEAANARFAAAAGAAEVAYDVRTAVRLLSSLVAHPERLRRMREAARRQKVPGATEAIASRLLRFLHDHRQDVSGAVRREGAAVPHLST
ncbi:MAG: glycosyltransferase [Alicyclobacillaceae bacterium]|nr:glycosyltransferase [Alicyclobacillaceae bacterium]